MKMDKAIFLKAQERIQIINENIAAASKMIITAYNDMNYINRPGITQDRIFDLCINELNAAIRRIEHAKKLYLSDGFPELKDDITSHFEQKRIETPRLPTLSTLREQDDHDEA